MELKTSKKTFFILLFLSYFVAFFIMAFLQTPEQMQWFKTLKQSPIAPPEITFSIVWSILYFLIPISAWFIWHKVSHTLFYSQYLTQIIWSLIFFQCHWLWLGVAVLACLCLINIAINTQFYEKSRLSGLLFAPYTLWCFFATLLNLTVAWLN